MLLVAVIGMLGAVGAAAVAFALARISEASARRRDGYAEATRELLAWAEYPYRIKRRTGDDALTLTRLADLGHELQESLRYREAWISAESSWVAEVFIEVRSELGAVVGPCCTDAWTSPPISSARGMNLDGWGHRCGRSAPPIRARFAVPLRVAAMDRSARWHPGA